MSLVTLETENQIATLILESPPANALSSTLLIDLNKKLDEVEKDDSLKVVLLRGNGRFFSAGADIKEFTTLDAPLGFEALSRLGQGVFKRMEQFHIPIIAIIHGAALGGGLELAMGCHIRIVSETAKLGLPELKLGVIPGFGGTQRLAQLVGTPKAYEMILTGEAIIGTEAARYGLANMVVKEDNLLEVANTLAEKIVANSKPSIHDIMKLVSYANRGEYEAGFDLEAYLFGRVFMNQDAQEGINAFIEKRKPKFNDQ